MKITFLVLVVLVYSSCSSLQQEYIPIENYLDSLGKEKIILVDRKIKNERTIKIFNGSFLLNTKTNSMERLGNQSDLYNLEDFNKMVKRYYNNDTVDYIWNKDSFRRKNMILIQENKFVKNELYKEYSVREELPVYMISNPISYRNDSICLFSVLQSNTTFSAPVSEYVVIMKKQKNKWVVIDKVWANENYIN